MRQHVDIQHARCMQNAHLSIYHISTSLLKKLTDEATNKKKSYFHIAHKIRYQQKGKSTARCNAYKK